jgi:hypothetical protein
MSVLPALLYVCSLVTLLKQYYFIKITISMYLNRSYFNNISLPKLFFQFNSSKLLNKHLLYKSYSFKVALEVFIYQCFFYHVTWFYHFLFSTFLYQRN